MRVERFKMEREGLVTEGQEVEISERSAVTGQYTYLVEPILADVRNLSYKTENKVKKGKNTENRTDRQRILSVSRD